MSFIGRKTREVSGIKSSFLSSAVSSMHSLFKVVHIFFRTFIIMCTSSSSTVMFCSLYTTLNTCLESKEANRYCLVSQLENLKLYRIVLSNSELIQPFKVALNIDGDCTPYLYGMNSRFQRYKQLWQILGVPDRFDFTTYLSVQNKCHLLAAKHVKCLE
jgi:hypothetical protein